MKIRKNIVLYQWQDEYVKSVSKKLRVSFSEAVRIMVSCCASKEPHKERDTEKMHFIGRSAWEKKKSTGCT